MKRLFAKLAARLRDCIADADFVNGRDWALAELRAGRTPHDINTQLESTGRPHFHKGAEDALLSWQVELDFRARALSGGSCETQAQLHETIFLRGSRHAA